MRLNYSPEADTDLERLHDFIADKHPLSARKAAIEIQESAAKLKQFPKIGLPVSITNTLAEMGDLGEIRDLYVGNYTLRYLIKDDETISVLRIWHSKESEKDR